jgi:uncharacterized protein (TIGR03435 family)
LGKNIRHVAIALLVTAATAALLAQAPPPRVAFEVATIKRNVSLGSSGSMGLDPGGRFRAVNAPLLWLILSAYGQFQRVLFESQIIGAPDWLKSEQYDITAKAGADIALLPAAEQFRRIPELLRSLLEDRFALRTHRETRQLPIYALVRLRKDDALGPQMRRSSLDCAREPAQCGYNGLAGHLTGGWITTEMLSNLLSNAVQRVVVDRTGLGGRFDVELEWSPDQSATDKPSIFTAVQEQLGLKLESDRGPVDSVVIDHVERPMED